MLTTYMTFWSIVMILAVGLWRVRSWRRILVAATVTALVLIFSQTLFVQLSVSAGLEPGMVWINPAAFLLVGPLGWLALLVMPCGWLGPIVGLNLVDRWQTYQREMV